MPFHKLPNEIVLEINDNLECANHRSMLARTSRGLYHILYRPLHQYNIDHQHCSGLIWSARHQKIAKSIYFLGLPRVNVNSCDEDGRTSLHVAAMQEDGHYIMRILVTRKDINVNAIDNYGRTPLSYAAASENIFSLTMLLERHDINVNLPDKHHETPLHFAVSSSGGYLAVKKLLVDLRTLPNKESSDGQYPLSIVAFKGDMKLLNIFMAAKRTDINFDCRSRGCGSPLQVALLCGHESFAIQLLQAPGLNLNSVHYYHTTPLILGIYLSGLDFMRCLLRNSGIEFNHQDMAGNTAVMTAAKRENIGALEMLLAKEEVDVDRRCILGKSVLDYARSCDNPKVMSIIKASGRFKDL